MSRLADLLSFLAENKDASHPAGCVAVTGHYDDPQRLAWSAFCGCPYSHPETMRGLRAQYARRGWVDTMEAGK